MEQAEFDEKIMSLVEQAVPRKLKKGKISRDMHLQKDLGIDSIGIAMMVFRLEEVFDVDLGDGDADVDMGRIRTVGDAIDASRRIVAQAAKLS